MKRYLIALALAAAAAAFPSRALACTNVIITPGASSDGSAIISYAADSHWLFGELYFRKAADWKAGTRLPIREWDTSRPLGDIAQAPHTYQTVGNMNQHQLIIGETTWGGREEQADKAGIMDYGSLIYITLQRARTAREAIQTIVSLAGEYGYPSEGETFSIADPSEAWIMDLVGKGSDGNKGIVWVARRIPDGYICAHANQARITRFPLNDPENCIYAPDVISFAREKGWYSGPDEEFSFRDAYNPLDFGGARGCEARAWSAFNILCDGQFTFVEDGAEVTRPASDWLDYAMGYDLDGQMPLFVKPSRKISVKDVADVMRDHYEGTPMDMRTDIGAGGNACPYRWRPMNFKWEGKTYVNERAIATQQTGFWFVAQARGWLPDEIGALVWFGCDDAATSYLTPIYANTSEIPECLREGNGDLLHYSPTSQFWICNRVANSCYRMYDCMEPVVREAVDLFENKMLSEAVPEMDSQLLKIYNGSGRKPGGKGEMRRTLRELTRFSVATAQEQFARWTELEQMLTVKFIDGNVKAQDAEGRFLHSKYSEGVPDGLKQPGYTDFWKAAVARDHGSVLEVK
ncbi:MAG: C69 family dipeptidase [Bacteroidales bacterium]|nr:C69 family dipeptidase [Bacteroidales bacterium]MBR0082788.1 C69 family dipeptidase [Bacteroidales bacterium]